MAESQDVMQLQRRARRRLVGAVALALFVIIAIPIVFDREPKPITQDLVIEIPSQDSKLKPLAPPPPAPAPQGEPSPQAAPEAPPAQTKAPAPPGEAKKAPEPPAAEARPSAPPAAQADAKRAQAILNGQGFIVPLGAFSNASKAKEIQAKATAAGFKAFTETVKGAKGELRAVRAGPFASREAAEQARDKLKAQGHTVGAVAAREQQ